MEKRSQPKGLLLKHFKSLNIGGVSTRDVAIDHNKVASINSLPVELLSRIFRNTLPPDVRFLRAELSGPPQLLCLVCSWWRKVAMETPSLWRSLRSERYHPTHLLPTYLSRSADLGLCLSFCAQVPSSTEYMMNFISHRRTETPADLFSPIMRTLRSHKHRLQHLEIRFNYKDFSSPHFNSQNLNRIMEGPFPALESLIVEYQGDFQTTHIDPLLEMTVFEETPSLYRLRLVNNRLNPLRLRIPWHQITSFTSDAPVPLHNAVTLLSSMPNLRRAGIHVARGHAIGLVHYTIPLLEKLHLTCSTDIASLLQKLQLPALLKLSIKTIANLDLPNSHEALTAFLAPFAQQLQRLDLNLTSCLIPEDDMITYLKLMPSLHTLTLVDQRPGGGELIGNALLRSLTLNQANAAEDKIAPSVCAKLKTLTLEYVSACQDDLIAAMVESRNVVNAFPGHKHEQLVFFGLRLVGRSESNSAKQLYRRLAPLKSRGLSLVIKSNTVKE